MDWIQQWQSKLNKQNEVAPLVRTGGSRHTGLAALPHRNIQACFEVMQALKLTKPQDDPVYLFLLKKEQEGKPYNVAKMAAVNKFLRIYYAHAMELYK